MSHELLEVRQMKNEWSEGDNFFKQVYTWQFMGVTKNV